MFFTGDLFPKWKGDLFLGSLLGKHLVRLRLAHDRVVLEQQLMMELGLRVRDVRQGPIRRCTF
jgi:glucose/arabinose dehydrogenase